MMLMCHACQRVFVDQQWIYPRYAMIEGKRIIEVCCGECLPKIVGGNRRANSANRNRPKGLGKIRTVLSKLR